MSVSPPPYALVVDSDDGARKLAAATLGQAGFIVAGFARPRGALAALAGRRADLAVVAARLPEGADGFAAAQQLRHCQDSLKVLFTGRAGASAALGPNDGGTVTEPFDRRRFLSAVFELMARGETDERDRLAAELGVVEAELDCLANRLNAGAGAEGGPPDLIRRMRDAVTARQAWLLAREAAGDTR